MAVTRWVRATLLAAGTAALASGPAAATATTTTTTTGPAAPPPIAASAVPCAAGAAGSCSVDPTTLQVSYDPEKDPTLVAVQVTWVVDPGRPRGAPTPQPSNSTTLALKAGSCTSKGGAATCSWAWPLTFPTKSKAWILNGSYQVTVCTSGGNPCSPSKAYAPTTLGLAVPPAAPASVRGSQSPDGGVSLTWRPAAAPEPDLFGYEVSRNGAAVYACSIDGAAPACPAGLSFEDQPAGGTWTYEVAALRYGATPSASAMVASAPVQAVVHVSAPSGAGPGPGPASLFLPPVPIIESLPGVIASAPPTTAPTSGGAPPTTRAAGSAQKLPYATPASPGQDPAALGGAATEPGPKSSDLDSVAAVALGLIALVLAAHVWYLRAEMRSFAARARPDASS